MIVKLLTEHHLEFLILKGGCRCSSESTHVKMPHCWKSHTLAHYFRCIISAKYYGNNIKYVGIQVNTTIKYQTLGYVEGIPIMNLWEDFVNSEVIRLRIIIVPI